MRGSGHGLLRGIPSHVYHARLPGMVGKSQLDLVAKAPLFYLSWLRGVEREQTKALRFGGIFHCALLEPSRFALTHIVEPDHGDLRTKAAKASRDSWRALHDGSTPITEDEYVLSQHMARAVHAHPLAGKMLQDGESELTVRWKDEASGIECKARADRYVPRHNMIIDIKTACDASADAFQKDVAKYRYHVQDAFYRRGFLAAGAPISHFVFLVVEKTPPFAVAVYELDSSAVDRGYELASRDLETLAACMKTDRWPGYPETIQKLSLPKWALEGG